MCGIAGIIGRIADENRLALRRMTSAMSHRGPDGVGFWESSADEQGWGVLLGHRRLAILDLSPAGAQPMVDPLAGHVIVFNGEIYNFQELRDRLLAGGERFDSTGDTQVMLRMLARNGADAVREFRGMFAFASWDPVARTLLLARDPLGIKPVYLARNPDAEGSWALAFASEVRALLASGLLVNPRLDPAAAASVAWNGFVPGPKTAISGVEAVRPGELRVFDGGGRAQRRERFWDISPAAPRDDLNEEQFSEMLVDCIRLHLISDVPPAVLPLLGDRFVLRHESGKACGARSGAYVHAPIRGRRPQRGRRGPADCGGDRNGSTRRCCSRSRRCSTIWFWRSTASTSQRSTD